MFFLTDSLLSHLNFSITHKFLFWRNYIIIFVIFIVFFLKLLSFLKSNFEDMIIFDCCLKCLTVFDMLVFDP